MKHFDIIPNEGIELAKFGESRGTLRDRLKAFRLIPSNPPTGPDHDFYPDIGLHIHYRDEVCHFIEFGTKAIPRFLGTLLLYRSFNAVKEWLLSQDDRLLLLRNGLRSLKFGIHVHAPGAFKGSDRIESVAIFDRQYGAEPFTEAVAPWL